MDTDQCKGLFGKLFGHKFKAQYDVEPPEHFEFTRCSADAFVKCAESLTKQTYVCAVCLRCGKKV